MANMFNLKTSGFLPRYEPGLKITCDMRMASFPRDPRLHSHTQDTLSQLVLSSGWLCTWSI
jgi:hypothetical protein